MTTLKLIAIGTSTGAVIPDDMLARLKVRNGDTLCAIETPEGYLLTPYDPSIEAQFQAGGNFQNAREITRIRRLRNPSSPTLPFIDPAKREDCPLYRAEHLFVGRTFEFVAVNFGGAGAKLSMGRAVQNAGLASVASFRIHSIHSLG